MSHHSLIKVGNKYWIKRTEYPKFDALVDLNKDVFLFENLHFIDECSLYEIKECIEEANEYIIKNRPQQK